MAPQAWDYARVEMNSARAQIGGEWVTRAEMLTARGLDCWELVTVIADPHEKWEAFYFKRPHPPTED